MALTSLLRKRVHFHVGLTEPALPTVQAAGEDTAPLRGFTASFGIGNLLTVAGIAATFVSGYATLRSQASNNSSRIDSLNARVVSRTEIDKVNSAFDSRLATLQAGQTQIVGVLLSRECH